MRIGDQGDGRKAMVDSEGPSTGTFFTEQIRADIRQGTGVSNGVEPREDTGWS